VASSRGLVRLDFAIELGGHTTSCSLAEQLRPKVKEILDDILSVVKENHKSHVEEQAKKSDIGGPKVPEAKGECIVI
jgi:hypothetical protein